MDRKAKAKTKTTTEKPSEVYSKYNILHDENAKTIINKITTKLLRCELYQSMREPFFKNSKELFDFVTLHQVPGTAISLSGVKIADFPSGTEFITFINCFQDSENNGKSFTKLLNGLILFADSKQQLHNSIITGPGNFYDFFALNAVTQLVNTFCKNFKDNVQTYKVDELVERKTGLLVIKNAFEAAQKELLSYLHKFYGVKNDNNTLVINEFNHYITTYFNDRLNKINYFTCYCAIFEFLRKTLEVRLSNHSITTYISRPSAYTLSKNEITETSFGRDVVLNKVDIKQFIPFISPATKNENNYMNLKEMNFEYYQYIVSVRVSGCNNYRIIEHEDESFTTIGRKNFISLFAMILCFAQKYQELVKSVDVGHNMIKILTLYVNRKLINLVVEAFIFDNKPLICEIPGLNLQSNSIDNSIFHCFINGTLCAENGNEVDEDEEQVEMGDQNFNCTKDLSL